MAANVMAVWQVFTIILCLFCLLTQAAAQSVNKCGGGNATAQFNYADVFPYTWIPPQNTQFECPQGWQSRGPQCLKPFAEELSWSDAATACSSMGAYLARIDLFSNNLFVGGLVNTIFPAVAGYWIGLTRTGSSGDYDGFWSDGSSVDLVVGNWAAGQPAGAYGTCAWVNSDATRQFPWSLDACTVKRPFVCQADACINGQFKCFNGRCVNRVYVCDGVDDCGDLSDEMNCPSQCSQVITGTAAGNIQSPNYPTSYPANATCLWLLQGPLATLMQLTFTAFATEANIDVVDIYVGGSTLVTSQYAGSISGTQIAASMPTYVSNNHLMIIRLTTDSTVQKTGFKANWKTTFTCDMGSLPGYGYTADPSLINTFTSTTEAFCQANCLSDVSCASFTFIIASATCNLHSQVWPPVKATAYNYWVKTCPGTADISEMWGLPGVGDVLTALSPATSPVQPLFSPGYPLPYFTNLRISWIIQAPNKWSLVTIQVLDVNLGPGDSVDVHDGATSVGTVLQTYVNDGLSNANFITTTQQFMYIAMTTVSQQPGRGFYFNYFAGCIYTITATTGTIQTPGYGVTSYPPSLFCQWRISVPTPSAGTGVTLTFNFQFDVNTADQLQVYADPGPSFNILTNPVLTSPNGQSAPANVYAASGVMLVTLTSGATGGGLGFSAIFSQDCPFPNLDVNTVASGDVALTYMSELSVQCKTGYRFTQEEYGQCPVNDAGATVTLQCLAGGVWSGQQLPTCALVHCGAPPSLDNGLIVNVTSLYYDGVASFACLSGFQFVDATNTKAVCQETGAWTSPSTCQGTTCPVFNAPDNGAVSIVYGDGVTYTSVLQITCNTGFELTQGLPTVFCQQNQTWSYEIPPLCTLLNCVVPMVTNGAVTSNGATAVTVQYGDTIFVTCNTGYQLLGASSSVTCNELGQFPGLPSCIDINECNNNPCVGGTNSCYNTDGSFYCVCELGYVLDATLVNCIDVDECSVDNGYCEQQCINAIGSYSCDCTDPWTVLYTANGTNGIFISAGESGLDPWDILQINRSCVPIYCVVPTILHASVLSEAAVVYYSVEGASVDVLCDVGYMWVMDDGSRGVATRITCQSDGTWSPASLSCIPATCHPLIIPPDVINAPTDVSSLSDVAYGDSVTWQCTVPGRVPPTFTASQTCFFDATTDLYDLVGFSAECGVIDCGPPNDVAGLDLSYVTTTTFNSTFTFQCLPGFTQNGTGPAGDTTVRCVADPRARWDYGTLTCTGLSCMDPGTPPDGYQNATTYEVTETVTFGCNRPGYQPNIFNVTCTPDITWSPSLPPEGIVCNDVTAPVFANCDTHTTLSVVVTQYDPIYTVTPTVTDNSGLVASLTSDTADLLSPIAGNLIIVWTASDSSGNTATCVMNVTVREQVPPTFTCPSSGYVYLSSDLTTQLSINASQATPSGIAVVSSNVVSPLQIVVNVSQLWRMQQFSQVAYDNFGNSARCSFQLVVAPSPCSQLAIRTPGNGGGKSCNVTGVTGRCQLTCAPGGRLYNVYTTPAVFTCNNVTNVYALSTDPTVTYVSDCMTPSNATYQQNFQVSYTTGTSDPIPPASASSYITAIKALLTGVQNSLQSLCNNITNSPRVVLNQTLVYDRPINLMRVTFSLQLVSSTQGAGVLQCASLVVSAFTSLSYAVPNNTAAIQLKTIIVTGLANISVLVTGNSPPSQSSVQVLLNNYSCPAGAGLQLDAGSFYCLNCSAGMQKVGEVCVPCPIGTYQSLAGQMSCTPCPNNTSTYTTGSSSLTQCISRCAAGFTSATGLPPCTQCPVSSYWTSPTACTPCPLGSITMATGTVNASLCLPTCLVGSYSPTGHAPCHLCPIGYYQDQSGQTSCIQCPLGFSTSNIGTFSAEQCQLADTFFPSNPCQNNGFYSSSAQSTSIFCSCPPGFTGMYCESYIDPCASKPCYHNGICSSSNSPGFYTCSCPPVPANNYTETPNSLVTSSNTNIAYRSGSTPLDCQNLCSTYDECGYAVFVFQSLTCFLYTAVGSSIETSYFDSSTYTRTIYIASIYFGDRCELSPDNCAVAPCHNEANCQNIQQADAYKCLCLRHSGLGLYTGTLCDVALDVCGSNPCMNQGTCITLNAIRYKCACQPGYTGYNCETNIDECASNPCLYGGTCTDMINAFNCTCPLGYTSDTCATRPASTCAVYNQPCTNGRCVDYFPTSSYTCTCDAGYTSDIYWTNWLSVPYNVSAGGYTITVQLLKSLGIEVCAEDVNGPIGAQCRVNGTHSVFNSATLAPQQLAIPCTIQGLACLNSDQSSGNCFAYDIQFQCNAKGLRCYHDDQCASNPCANGGTCTSLVDTYTCQCVAGYTGSNCQHLIDYCVSSPCLYGGQCVPLPNAFSCTCPSGFGGSVCQNVPNNCVTNACNTTGTMACNSTLDSYTCMCKLGYTASYCDTIIDNCLSLPCHHGAKCTNAVNGFQCACTIGYTGHTCQNLTLNLCHANTCANGVCVDGVTDFLCRCNANYYGRNCSQGQGVCEVVQPCLNGGVCSDTLTGATCTCPQNYTGSANCQCERDYCSATDNICENGAACTMISAGNFLCTCPPGYTGTTCGSIIDNCVGVNCGIGTCINTVISYYCACPVGFIGDTCNKTISRNVDMCLSDSMGVLSISTFLVSTPTLTVAFWLRYTNIGDSGQVLSLFGTGSQQSLFISSFLATFDWDSVKIYLADGSAQTLTYAKAINDGVWHYVTLTLSSSGGQSRVAVYVDTVTNTDATATNIANVNLALSNYAIVYIYSSFDGCLSLIQVWDSVLTQAQMSAVIAARNKDVIPSWYLAGLIWDYGYGQYHSGDGVTLVSPSSRGLRVCPTGQKSVINTNGQNVCIGADRSLPYLVQCPSDVTSPVSPGGYASMTWSGPVFTGATATISNFLPGGAFSLGIEPVMYVANNSVPNYNSCAFRAVASLGTCTNLPSAPSAGNRDCVTIQDGLGYTRCTVSCPSGMAFLHPTPAIFSCWEAGVWNTSNPYADLSLPPCGNLGPVYKHVDFGFAYNLDNGFSAGVLGIIQSAVQATLFSWNQQLSAAGGGVCFDQSCSDINYIIFESNGQPSVNIVLARTPATVGDGVDVGAAVVQAVIVNQLFTIASLPGADYIDPTTFTLTITNLCDANAQLVGDQCVQCPPGTYYDSTSELCVNCDVGTYQDQPMMTSCVACGMGLTTRSDGSSSASDCISSCNAGHYYDSSSASCQPCPQSQYQSCNGSSYCLYCPAGMTTSFVGATSVDDCYTDCPSGYQLLSNGSCIICDVGTYRLLGFQSNCTQCPAGVTTQQRGSTKVTDCNTVVCVPGTYREGNNPGQCVPCPNGYYRNSTQDNCTACGDLSQWRTADVGADDASKCLFYCPAGQFISSLNTCSNCSRTSYKDLSDDNNYYATSCTLCPPPLTVTAYNGSISLNACQYPACTAGQVVDPNDVTSCVNCPINTYQSNPIPTTDTCTDCPPNTGTASDGASLCSIQCPSGQEMNAMTQQCQPCARGYYKDNSVSPTASFAACQPCPSGTITPTTGSTLQSQCIQGDCPPGSYMDPNINTQCNLCDIGTYQPGKWQMTCLSCPSGSTTTTTGSIYPSDCNVWTNTNVYLLKFTITLSFIPNYFDRQSASLVQLKTQMEYMITNLLKSEIQSFRGTAQAVAFVPDNDNNIVVAMQVQFNQTDVTAGASLTMTLDGALMSGLWTDPTGVYNSLPVSSASATVYIGVADNVRVCAGGRAMNFVSGACGVCGVGKYQIPWMTQLCAPCPTQYSTLTNTTVGYTSDSCFLVCEGGSEATDGVTCQPCDYDSYKTSPSPANCTSCGLDLITLVTGATSLSQCQASCTPGYYSSGRLPLTTPQCLPCPQGTYQNSTDQLTCLPCPSYHNTSSTGATDFTDCKDVCSLNTGYCQNGGACWFDTNTKLASCNCTILFTADRCQSFSWVLWVIIACCILLVLVAVLVTVLCVRRKRMQVRNPKPEDQRKLKVKDKGDANNDKKKSNKDKRDNDTKSRRNSLSQISPQAVGEVKSRPLGNREHGSVSAHMMFFDPPMTYHSTGRSVGSRSSLQTLSATMSPGYAPSLIYPSPSQTPTPYMYYEDLDDSQPAPNTRPPTKSVAFYQVDDS